MVFSANVKVNDYALLFLLDHESNVIEQHKIFVFLFGYTKF